MYSPRCDSVDSASHLGLFCLLKGILLKNEPPHGKTNNLPRRKQRRRSASNLQYLNPKYFKLLALFCDCTGGFDCWFSHEAAQMKTTPDVPPINLDS